MHTKKDIQAQYPNLYELDGSILDAESYEKHLPKKENPVSSSPKEGSSFSGSAASSHSSSGASGFYGGYGLHLI